jgi:hypothetical protein
MPMKQTPNKQEQDHEIAEKKNRDENSGGGH